MSESDGLPFWRVVRADLYRYGCGVSVGALFKHYCNKPGFRYTFWMRLANHFRHKGATWRPWYYLSRAMLRWQSLRYGISIPYNARIAPGLYIGHFGGIVLSDKLVVGRDCNINHGVTIGVKFGGKNPGVPVIGDRVFFGPGCVVIGGIRIGNDVAIGANAVVVESVPDSAVVVGVPARVVSDGGSSAYVINTGYGEADGPS